MSALALLGGKPVLGAALPRYNSLGAEESHAVSEVMRSGCLSGFYGSWGDEFFGGPRVLEFEAAWRARFRVKHAVSVNSATSGLYAAMGAVGIVPGDEVVVPPYTMSATAMAPLVYGGVPVFADIDERTFCLDPEAVLRVISPRTKAILAVNLFGHPAPLAKLRALADARGLYLVEDNAQGPLAEEAGRKAGTIGHIGVFSLNYHKHIHTGEGGMCVTDDDELALRLQMIRNHAENIVDPVGRTDLAHLLGFNYRLTELSAAVGLEQLKKADAHVGRRERLAAALTRGIDGLTGLVAPVVREGCRHVYYTWSMRVQSDELGATRTQFSRALAAEGFPHFTGYVRPLYRLPLFQRRGEHAAGHPLRDARVSYDGPLCPVTERMHADELLCFENCMYDVDERSERLLVEAIRKVHEHRAELSRMPSA